MLDTPQDGDSTPTQTPFTDPPPAEGDAASQAALDSVAIDLLGDFDNADGDSDVEDDAASTSSQGSHIDEGAHDAALGLDSPADSESILNMDQITALSNKLLEMMTKSFIDTKQLSKDLLNMFYGQEYSQEPAKVLVYDETTYKLGLIALGVVVAYAGMESPFEG